MFSLCLEVCSVSAAIVVKASALRAVDPRFDSRLRWDFSGSGHDSELALQWLRWVSTGTGWHGVSIL